MYGLHTWTHCMHCKIWTEKDNSLVTTHFIYFNKAKNLLASWGLSRGYLLLQSLLHLNLQDLVSSQIPCWLPLRSCCDSHSDCKSLSLLLLNSRCSWGRVPTGHHVTRLPLSQPLLALQCTSCLFLSIWVSLVTNLLSLPEMHERVPILRTLPGLFFLP